MRNGQNNKRMRNRNNNNNNNNNNRRGQNPMTRVFESNGPDIKIRGTASHIAEKYLQLARDARSSGDPVAAENYYQHAEHYFRLIAAAQEQFRQNQPQQQPRPDDAVSEDSEDDGENYSNFGQEPGFVSQPNQPQPYMRDRDNGGRDHQRDNQPYQRGDREQQPREHREPVRSRNMCRSRNPSRRPRIMAASIDCPPSSPARSRRSTAALKAMAAASASRDAGVARTARAPKVQPRAPRPLPARISIRATSSL